MLLLDTHTFAIVSIFTKQYVLFLLSTLFKACDSEEEAEELDTCDDVDADDDDGELDTCGDVDADNDDCDDEVDDEEEGSVLVCDRKDEDDG